MSTQTESPERPPVAIRIVNHRGPGPDISWVKLRDGRIIEIGDDGLHVFRSLSDFKSSTFKKGFEPEHSITFLDSPAPHANSEPQRGSIIPAQGCDAVATLGSSPPQKTISRSGDEGASPVLRCKTGTPNTPAQGWNSVSDFDLRFSTVQVPQLCDLLLRLVTWQRRQFPHQTLRGKLEHLLKEATELRDCQGQDPGEWADVFLLLLGALALEGHTFDDLVRFAHEKLTLCEGREWPAEPDATGCYHHIKE